MRANPDTLLAELEKVYPPGKGLDLPAALFALAGIESDYELGASGDGGASRGLWQVHLPDWQRVTGPYAPQGDATAWEVRWIRPLVGDLLARMGNVAGALAAAGIEVDADQVPYWPALAWQLRPETLARAVQHSASSDPHDWIDVLWPDRSSALSVVEGADSGATDDANQEIRQRELHRLERYAQLYDSHARGFFGELTNELERGASVAGATVAGWFRALSSAVASAVIPYGLAQGAGGVLALGFLGWLAWKFFGPHNRRS